MSTEERNHTAARVTATTHTLPFDRLAPRDLAAVSVAGRAGDGYFFLSGFEAIADQRSYAC
jgi:hypothetical protein